MKHKGVIAAHLQRGLRIEIHGHEGFYRVETVTKRGPYVDVELQGVFYPVCFFHSDFVKVKL